MQYFMNKALGVGFQEALQRVKDGLQKEGFGVLTEIDIKETLKKKLNIDFRNYRILGACNPPLAHKALEAEKWIGLLLPCNVVVQESPEGKVEVAAIDPLVSMRTVGNPGLEALAGQVRSKLEKVISAL